MKYTELSQYFKNNFDFLNQERVLDDGLITIRFCDFISELQTLNPANGSLVYDENILAILKDNAIVENSHFQYPVFIPKNMDIGAKPIILLHGLNERSWAKYLPWAYRLATHTNRGVILFPIAYHINRAPESWGNPRAMQELVSARKNIGDSNSDYSFANASLSNRLSDHPVRFFTSGRQSANDLIHLISELKSGKHPLFQREVTPDFFAYSIGAFLAQILFLANPDELLNGSKLFLFCGGAFFSDMKGLSKMIMDKNAFNRIQHYYLREFEQEMASNTPLKEYFSNNGIAKAFWSMISKEHFSDFRENRFDCLRSQIKVVALKKDFVIPAEAIKLVFPNVEIVDFNFEYTHETPFPIGNAHSLSAVDEAFELIFQKSTQFFNNED